MDHVKKMVLVDPRVLESLPQQAPTPPLVAALADSGRAMSRALHDRGLTDEERLDEYRRELASYRNLQEQHATRTPIPVRVVGAEVPATVEAGKDVGERELTERDEETLQTIPKNYKRRARLILHRLRKRPGYFNKRDELVFGGKPIPGSHIVDLVNDAVRPKRKRLPPAGSRAFASVLQRLNTPQEAIGNPLYNRPAVFAEAEDFEYDDEDASEYEEEPETAGVTPRKGEKLPPFRDYKI